MAVTVRSTSGTGATGTSWTVNFPSSMATPEILLVWIVGKTGTVFNTPSGWRQVYAADSGGVSAALFTRAWASGSSDTFTGTSTDIGYVSVTWSSNAVPAGVTLGFGNNGYTGTGSDPVDSGDTYTYSADGKGDVDTATDTLLGVFSGGIMCPTDLPLYFYANKGAASAPTVSVGGEDTLIGAQTLPTTTTIKSGAIWSNYREGARGFTLSASATTVAFGTWLSENASTGSGGGPGGNGTVNSLPLTRSESAKNTSYPNSNGRATARIGYIPSGRVRAHEGGSDITTISVGRSRLASFTQVSKEPKQTEQGGSINVV